MTAPEVLTPPADRALAIADVKAFAATELSGQNAQFESFIDAVTLDAEQRVLWRAIVAQERRVYVDYLGGAVQLEPFRTTDADGTDAPPTVQVWGENGVATDVDSSVFYTVPERGILALRRNMNWPRSERSYAPFSVTYWAGWDATAVPEAVKQLLVRMASYQFQNRGQDGQSGRVKLPSSITAIGRGYSLRRPVMG